MKFLFESGSLLSPGMTSIIYHKCLCLSLPELGADLWWLVLLVNEAEPQSPEAIRHNSGHFCEVLFFFFWYKMNISPSELWVKQTALPNVGGPRLIIWRHHWPKGWSSLSKKTNSARRWSLGFFNCNISIFLGSSAYWSTLKMLDLSGPMTAWANSLIINVLLEIKPESSLEGLMLKLKLHYLPTWFKELTPWKRPWCWERLKAAGEGDHRGWDGWVASPTQWTRI